MEGEDGETKPVGPGIDEIRSRLEIVKEEQCPNSGYTQNEEVQVFSPSNGGKIFGSLT